MTDAEWQGRMHALYARIPTFECAEGCHDCCRAKPPPCPKLGPDGCTVYAQRPLLCRLFGSAEGLPCPRGRGPEKRIPIEVSREIVNEYHALTGDKWPFLSIVRGLEVKEEV